MNKTSGGRILSEQNQIEFQLSYFSPKRCCCESAALNMLANLDNSAVATGLEKVSFHSSSKERQCQRIFKLPHIELISHTCKVMFKILQARLQQYVNGECPDVQAGFRKGRGIRVKMPTSVGSQKKQENSRKISTSASLTMLKPLFGSQQTVGNS